MILIHDYIEQSIKISLYLLWLGYFFCCNGNYDLISLKKIAVEILFPGLNVN